MKYQCLFCGWKGDELIDDGNSVACPVCTDNGKIANSESTSEIEEIVR